MRKLACVLAVALVFAFGGCQTTATTETGTSGPINANCAMIPANAINAECYVEHKGQKIGFCGNNCKANFEGMTEAEKDARVANLPKK